MIQDLLALPITGGALLAGGAYAALSIFVTGPLVAERTIEKSGSPALCARSSAAGAQAATPLSSLPADCGAVFGIIYGKEGEAFCARYGEGFSRAFDLLGSIRNGDQDAAGAIVMNRASSESRCLCATRTVLEDRRFDFALYAGTARLVTPLPVRTLDAELTRAALTPACAAKG